jgi:hypothetical protein
MYSRPKTLPVAMPAFIVIAATQTQALLRNPPTVKSPQRQSRSEVRVSAARLSIWRYKNQGCEAPFPKDILLLTRPHHREHRLDWVSRLGRTFGFPGLCSAKE